MIGVVKLVSISGACSRAGKTATAATLLESLPRGAAVAVKFTTTDDVFERCPRGTPCVVCNIEVPFRMIEDPNMIRQPGTDTDRLAAAGAGRVIWTIAKTGSASVAWAALRRRVAPDDVLVMEGSTIVDLARPQLHLFVVHPFLSPDRWKPTSARLIRKADLVVVNRPGTDRRAPAASVMAAVRQSRGHREVRVADVTRPLGEWAPDLVERLAVLANGSLSVR